MSVSFTDLHSIAVSSNIDLCMRVQSVVQCELVFSAVDTMFGYQHIVFCSGKADRMIIWGQGQYFLKAAQIVCLTSALCSQK